VVLNTGEGLKYPAPVAALDLPVLPVGTALPAAGPGQAD